MEEKKQIIIEIGDDTSLKNQEKQFDKISKIIVPYGMADKFKQSPAWYDVADVIEEAPEPKFTLRERIGFVFGRFKAKIRKLFNDSNKYNDEEQSMKDCKNCEKLKEAYQNGHRDGVNETLEHANRFFAESHRYYETNYRKLTQDEEEMKKSIEQRSQSKTAREVFEMLRIAYGEVTPIMRLIADKYHLKND